MSWLEDCSSWAQHRTNRWMVSGGGSISCGALGFVEAKVFTFENLDVRRSKSLLLVSAGVGAKLEAKVKAGDLAKLLKTGERVRHATNALGNPNSQAAESVSIHCPFCLNDLYMAVAVGISTGVDGGVVGTSVSGLSFVSRRGRLFSISGAQVEAIIGVGVNIVSYQGGVLFGVACSNHLPSKYSPFRARLLKQVRNVYNPRRMHPGKI